MFMKNISYKCNSKKNYGFSGIVWTFADIWTFVKQIKQSGFYGKTSLALQNITENRNIE